MHRDLKLDNILLHMDEICELPNYPLVHYFPKCHKIKELLFKNRFTIKIADLGFSKKLQEGVDVMTTYCGTPLNMAPEILNKKNYTSKGEIWSLGVLLYQMLTGEYPFMANSKDELKQMLLQGTINLPSNRHLSLDSLDLINNILQYQPKDRFSMDQILAHPFLQ